MANEQTERILSLMRRINMLGQQDVRIASDAIKAQDGGIRGEFDPSASSLQRNQEALDYASKLIDDIVSGNEKKKQYGSLASYSAAVNQNIQKKRKALRALDAGKQVGAAEQIDPGYIDPVTGQAMKLSETNMGRASERQARYDAYNTFVDNSDTDKQLMDIYRNLAGGTQAELQGLSGSDYAKQSKLLIDQVRNTITNRDRQVMDMVSQERTARIENAQAFKESSERQANEALALRREKAEKSTAEQERELRQSIEDDKRSLAAQSASLNRSRGRKVRVTSEVDQQRPE